ncbi:MAG: iron export ABC transporter permease subunit FetB [Proteobacteria bacterium]|nr:iron export ABC transporter permease subunit FetB [Pseudomonadota bacterium]
MNNPLYIGNWQLALGVIFIFFAGAASLVHKLGLGKDLAVGTVRTFAQLFLMGYALTIIFQLTMGWVVVLIYAGMIFFAAWTVRGRVTEKQVRFFFPTLGAMMASYMLVTILITGVIVQAEPWWDPRYFLPLGGMVVGNSMTAISLSLDRFFSDLRTRREEVEMKLSLGADYKEASRDIFASAISAGMIPSINSMMGVGLVFIPGMMTGQVLTGADPMDAVRYQIIVMLMLVGSTAIGSLLVTWLVRRRCFGPAHQLVLTRSLGGGS